MNHTVPTTHRRHLLALGLAASLGVPLAARAQDQSANRPLRILVPFTAGGAGDIAVRMMEKVLSPVLGVPVVVDNRPGADGTIAVAELMRSPADGSTIMFATATTVLYVPLTHPTKPPYDPLRDFDPVSHFSSFTFFVIAHESLGVTTIPQLIAHLKANPGKVAFGYGDSTSLIGMAQFEAQAQVDVVNVPYKGSAQALTDFMGDRLQLIVGDADTVAKIKGKGRPLAVLLAKRSPLMPDVPTFGEVGFPQVNVRPWSGFVAPARTPKPVLDRLSAAITLALTDAKLKEFFAARGSIIEGSTPEAFRQLISEQLPVWRDAIKFAKIPVE